jgi:hypothetical protein
MLSTLAACLFLGGSATEAQTKPSGLLSGVVLGSDDRPVSGAKVIVQSVWVSTRAGWAEANSYEAGKETVTSTDGRFALGGLQGEAFEIVIVAAGHHGRRLPLVRAGESIEVRLTDAEDKLPPQQRIRVRLIDESDGPVVGARLRVEAVYDLRNRTRPGDLGLVESEGISDLNGEIELHTQMPRVGIGGWITARNAVAELISAYPAGVEGRDRFELTDERGAYSVLRLSRGFAASGMLWSQPQNPSDGRPLPGQVVEIVRVTSNPRHVDRTRVITGDDGRFEFPRVAAHLSFRYYGVLGQPGATLTSELTVDPEALDEDRVLDVGALLCPPTVRLSGRVVLEGGLPGEAVDPGLRLRLKRSRGWDSVATSVDPEGRFDFEYLPIGLVAEVSLESDAPPAEGGWGGLILSGDQPGYDVATDAIVGVVESQTDGMVIRVRRGKRLPLTGLTPQMTAELREQRDRLEAQPLGKSPAPRSESSEQAQP